VGVKEIRCEMGVKIFQLSNAYKIILGVEWVEKYFRCLIGVNIS